MAAMKIPQSLRALLTLLVQAGARPLIVGGSVRDHVLGKQPKDFDVEVFDMPADLLETVLSASYKVDAVGRAFGVLKVTVRAPCTCTLQGNGHHDTCPVFEEKVHGIQTYDVSLPRTDSKAGEGHRGFVVTTDPHMTFAQAALRRDFTMNAMAWDFQDPETIIDPYGGQEDLAAKRLRHVSPAFAEDPLRVMRACQFAARFDLTLDPETVALCQTLVPELRKMSVERYWEEWKKLLLKAETPSKGLYALVETGAIRVFPEVEALLHVNQDPEWHPEGQDHPLGSLWVHNCMVTDQAARVVRDDALTDETEALIVMLGAFCHDLGKPATTVFKAKDNDPGGEKRWRAHAHEEAGVEPTTTFLTSIGAPPAIIEAVVPLVAHHLKPFHYARDRASDSAIRRLALKAPLVRLCRVARADHLGRTTPDALACQDSREIEDIKWLLERASMLKVERDGPSPLLMGRHLIDLGLKPGPDFKKILGAAFEAQLDGSIVDTESAVSWAKTYLGQPA